MSNDTSLWMLDSFMPKSLKGLSPYIAAIQDNTGNKILYITIFKHFVFFMINCRRIALKKSVTKIILG